MVDRVDTHTGEVEHIEIPCGRKACPHCRERLRKRYVAHFVSVFRDLPNLTFVTLTVDPKNGVKPKESAKYLKHIWERKFIKRVKRRNQGELKYLASVEKHQSGQAHLHVVMATTLTEDELRDQWAQSGGGVVMEAESVQKGRSLARRVGYVVKYVFKDAARRAGGNAVLASNGIGYHSKAAKEKRRQWAAENAENGALSDSESGRYVVKGPKGGGRRDEGQTVTEAEKRRFDLLEQQARSTQYIRWEDQQGGRSLPRDGVRIVYDRSTGKTKRERVRKVSTGPGQTSIVTIGPASP